MESFDSAQRARVITPVGLDIDAQTPDEIAVSIVGQLIAIRTGKRIATSNLDTCCFHGKPFEELNYV